MSERPSFAQISTDPVCGDVSTSPTDQSGTVQDDAVASSCGIAKSCPGVSGPMVPYVASSFTNDTGADVCLTVDASSPCTDNSRTAVVTYLGSFDPGDPCANYLADGGGYIGSGTAVTYKVIVPKDATFVVVAAEEKPGNDCGMFCFALSTESCDEVPDACEGVCDGDEDCQGVDDCTVGACDLGTGACGTQSAAPGTSCDAGDGPASGVCDGHATPTCASPCASDDECADVGECNTTHCDLGTGVCEVTAADPGTPCSLGVCDDCAPPVCVAGPSADSGAGGADADAGASGADEDGDSGGCGCSSSPDPASAGWMLFGFLVLAWQRRRARR